MKKIILSMVFLFVGSILYAQTIVTTVPQYQTALLEEYTGIHCVYCPDGHKLAKELKADYPGRVILVNVHEGGYAAPGAGEPDFRTPYGTALSQQTGLTGYPSGTINRRVFPALNSVMALSRGQWGAAAEEVMTTVSPLNLGATTTYNPTTRVITINVEALYTATAANSTNLLNIALIQDSIEGPQTGGSTFNPGDVLPNGNYVHGHVLRDFITGQWGDTISNTTMGALYSKTFTYTIPADVNGVTIDPDHCHLAIYATEAKGNITQGITLGIDGGANDGNNHPFYGSFDNLTNAVLAGSASATSTFSFDFNSTISGNEDFVFELTSDAPAGWAGTYKVDGITYTSNDTVSISGSNPAALAIEVTPDASPAVALYTLTVYPVFDPVNADSIEVNVISGVTDLIVNGSGSWGDGGSYNFEQVYVDGLVYAGNSTHDVTTARIMQEAIDNNALAGVNNVYLNIAWTFPSFSDDEATALMDFMDNGGNVFVAGQDIGWDINAPTGYGTPVTKNMYTNYFNIEYIDDGSAARNQLNAQTADMIFGNVSSSTLIDAYAGNMYPDKISPKNGSEAIFTYNNAADIGATRYTDGNYKLVYFGVGMEMIQDVAVKNEILKLSHQWFNGIVSNEEFDFASNGFQVFPNPSEGDFAIITPVTGKYKISITNIAGVEVYSEEIDNNSKEIQIKTNDLPAGAYLLRVNYGNQSISGKIMIQ